MGHEKDLPKSEIHIIYMPRHRPPKGKPIKVTPDDQGLVTIGKGSHKIVPGTTVRGQDGIVYALVHQDIAVSLPLDPDVKRDQIDPIQLNEVAENNYTRNVFDFIKGQRLAQATSWFVIILVGLSVMASFWFNYQLGEQLDDIQNLLIQLQAQGNNGGTGTNPGSGGHQPIGS